MLHKNIVTTVAGLDQAGKSTLVRRLTHGDFIDKFPTIGVDIETIHDRGRVYTLVDMGGHIAFRDHIWQRYAMSSHGIIFVYDAVDRDRIDEASYWFWRVFEWAKKVKVILFLANKQDLPKTVPLEKIVKKFKFKEITESMDFSVRIFPISAKTGEGVDDAVSWFTESLRKHIKVMPVTPLATILLRTDGSEVKRRPRENLPEDVEVIFNVLKDSVHELPANHERVNYFMVKDRMLMYLHRADRIVAAVFDRDVNPADARLTVEELAMVKSSTVKRIR